MIIDMKTEVLSQDKRGYMVKFVFAGETFWFVFTKKGYARGGESHPINQHNIMVSGKMLFKMMVNGAETEQIVDAGQTILFPKELIHVAIALEDTIMLEWHDGILPPLEQKKIYEPYRQLTKRKNKIGKY